MKYLFLLFGCLMACSAETVSEEKTVQYTENNKYEMPPSSGDHRLPCPKPITYSSIQNGRNVIIVIDPICEPMASSLKPIFGDPPYLILKGYDYKIIYEDLSVPNKMDSFDPRKF